MKKFRIHSMVFHPNGVFVQANVMFDFWFFLGKHIGWGRFTMIRPCEEFSPGGAEFELAEILPADAKHPDPKISDTGVLWSRREALEAEMTMPLYAEHFRVTSVYDEVAQKVALHEADNSR